jgi:hypothetical protein
MNFKHLISVVDHTLGEPIHIIIDVFGKIYGHDERSDDLSQKNL